jgi:hypothetical protein
MTSALNDWTDADRQFAVFGLVAADPAQGS